MNPQDLGAARSTGSPRGLRIDGRARMLFPTRPGAAVLGVANASMSLQESGLDEAGAVGQLGGEDGCICHGNLQVGHVRAG